MFQRSLNDNVIYPLVTKSFIYDNFACQKGKGTDKARDRLACFLRRMYREHGTDFYVLQIDIKGYYPNMRHDVPKKIFQRKLPPEAYEMAARVLDGQYLGRVGFAPGSQMVQICGIAVLDPLDHHIKERLRVKCYLRYMDDLILIHHDRAFLESCLLEIRDKLSAIGFQTNPSKTGIYHIRHGIPFLGFRFRMSDTGKVYKTIDPRNVKSERKKLVRMAALVRSGRMTRKKVDACYESWRAHASKGNTYNLIKRMDAFYKTLWIEEG